MNDVEYLQESVLRGLVEAQVAEKGVGLADALDFLVETRTFDRLMDEETGLYRESPSYANVLLDEELRG